MLWYDGSLCLFTPLIICLHSCFFFPFNKQVLPYDVLVIATGATYPEGSSAAVLKTSATAIISGAQRVKELRDLGEDEDDSSATHTRARAREHTSA